MARHRVDYTSKSYSKERQQLRNEIVNKMNTNNDVDFSQYFDEFDQLVDTHIDNVLGRGSKEAQYAETSYFQLRTKDHELDNAFNALCTILGACDLVFGLDQKIDSDERAMEFAQFVRYPADGTPQPSLELKMLMKSVVGGSLFSQYILDKLYVEVKALEESCKGSDKVAFDTNQEDIRLKYEGRDRVYRKEKFQAKLHRWDKVKCDFGNGRETLKNHFKKRVRELKENLQQLEIAQRDDTNNIEGVTAYKSVVTAGTEQFPYAAIGRMIPAGRDQSDSSGCSTSACDDETVTVVEPQGGLHGVDAIIAAAQSMTTYAATGGMIPAGRDQSDSSGCSTSACDDTVVAPKDDFYDADAIVAAVQAMPSADADSNNEITTNPFADGYEAVPSDGEEVVCSLNPFNSYSDDDCTDPPITQDLQPSGHRIGIVARGEEFAAMLTRQRAQDKASDTTSLQR